MKLTKIKPLFLENKKSYPTYNKKKYLKQFAIVRSIVFTFLNSVLFTTTTTTTTIIIIIIIIIIISTQSNCWLSLWTDWLQIFTLLCILSNINNCFLNI